MSTALAVTGRSRAHFKGIIMTSKEVLLLQRFCEIRGTTWDAQISEFCDTNLARAKAWARAQKVETIDDLLANTEPVTQPQEP